MKPQGTMASATCFLSGLPKKTKDRLAWKRPAEVTLWLYYFSSVFNKPRTTLVLNCEKRILE